MIIHGAEQSGGREFKSPHPHSILLTKHFARMGQSGTPPALRAGSFGYSQFKSGSWRSLSLNCISFMLKQSKNLVFWCTKNLQFLFESMIIGTSSKALRNLGPGVPFSFLFIKTIKRFLNNNFNKQYVVIIWANSKLLV